LQQANLTLADLTGAEFYEALVEGTNFCEAKGLAEAKNLHTTRCSNVEYFEFVDRHWLEKRVSWEQLRVLGRLPLFGASWAALVAIPFFYYALDLYNRKVDLLRVWAEEQIVSGTDHNILAHAVLQHLHRELIPSLSLLTFFSTIFLVFGSTTFALFCPSRVKEFSLDQWRDQLGHSLIYYWPLAWRHRWLRVACVCCYAIGGVGAVWVLANKLLNVFWYIVQNASASWSR
jgi:hypothetical protein